jgi:prevent-host-death family protein
MKTVTIREAQHNLSKILLAVEAGETVQITRRRMPLARLVPEPSRSDNQQGVDWGQHSERLISLRPSKQATNTDTLLDELRGDR